LASRLAAKASTSKPPNNPMNGVSCIWRESGFYRAREAAC
jgi:hypothetical protein